ncbi:MAG: ABC transporter ATP-binding protein [Anaerolineales bacterium]|nr:ABC transporter ATP-binding protein [Anaerolineales bacterium]
MKHTIAIQTQDLHKYFGQVKALEGVSLKIERGQIFGLLGPNGAGKTTFIRLLIGATKPTFGQLSILGFDPIKQKHAIRKLIGYMPQSPSLYEDLSPRENIHFFGRAHRIENISQRVDEVIGFVGLSERAHDPVYKFSGGMKQRVSLACALVHQPKMLLLDEPTSGIDPKLRETFWKHFRELSSKGVTILVSTHQMNEAMFCDRLAILHQGTLLVDETPRQLLWNNRSRIKIWRGEQVNEHHVVNYPEQLPRVLQSYGLDSTISRIEIEEDTLESVVLRMINGQESQEQNEPKDDQYD